MFDRWEREVWPDDRKVHVLYHARSGALCCSVTETAKGFSWWTWVPDGLQDPGDEAISMYQHDDGMCATLRAAQIAARKCWQGYMLRELAKIERGLRYWSEGFPAADLGIACTPTVSMEE